MKNKTEGTQQENGPAHHSYPRALMIGVVTIVVVTIWASLPGRSDDANAPTIVIFAAAASFQATIVSKVGAPHAPAAGMVWYSRWGVLDGRR